MSSATFTNPEPLVLFDRERPQEIFDRDGFFELRAKGTLGRKALDTRIHKVLPAWSRFKVANTSQPSNHLVRVEETDYSPFCDHPLHVLPDLVIKATFDHPRHSPARSIDVGMALNRLRSAVDVPYLWGGTSLKGSPRQAEWLVERGFFSASDLEDRELGALVYGRGFDCSGLFNWATEYAFFGDVRHLHGLYDRVQVHSLTVNGAVAALQPLDLIVYPGHVIIALGDGEVIQAVGEGENAEAFAQSTGWSGLPLDKYDRVVIDRADDIFGGLLEVQERALFDGSGDPARAVCILRPTLCN